MMWARIAGAILGLWLMAAPAVLGYDVPASINDRIIGPIAASFAVIAIWEVTRPLRWTGVVLGLWLVIAPWLLGYGPNAFINSTVVGLLMAALAMWKGSVNQRIGGGWSSLWPPCPQDGREAG